MSFVNNPMGSSRFSAMLDAVAHPINGNASTMFLKGAMPFSIRLWYLAASF
jgi:hypothetical protein